MDTVDLTTKSWERMSKKQRKEFLKTMGHKSEWANIGNLREVVSRGGGFVARDLHTTVKTWKKRNPNVKIKW